MGKADKAAEKKAARTSAGRPQQPKCESCGKAMYKRMDAGPVKTDDAYGWCRNPECEHYNQDVSGSSRFKPLEGVSAPKKSDKADKKAKPAPEAKAKEKGDKSDKPKKSSKATAAVAAAEAEAGPTSKPELNTAEALAESRALSKARKRITKIIEGDGESKAKAIGVALGLLNQETGSKDDSNRLISELNLEQYGIAAASGDKAKKSKKKKKRSTPAAEA